jgi:hypothetical protein
MKGVEENPGSRWRSATALTRYRDDGRLDSDNDVS